MSTIAEIFKDALAHHQAGRLEDAVRLYRSILAVDPGNAASLNNLTIAHTDIGLALARREDHAAALVHLKQAYILSPDNEAVRRHLSGACSRLGLTLLKRENHAEALSCLTQSHLLTPEDGTTRNALAFAHTQIGVALALRGLHTEALPHLEMAQALEPRSETLHRNLAINRDRDQSLKMPGTISHRALINRMEKLEFPETRQNIYRRYEYDQQSGLWHDLDSQPGSARDLTSFAVDCHGLDKVHYGCGDTILPGWLNIALNSFKQKHHPHDNYLSADLLEKHPFKNDTIGFGFCEDFLEHLSQSEAIFFLSEIYRTFKPTGVIRLCYPGLKDVLKENYHPASESKIRSGELNAYCLCDHKHFFSDDELACLASHLGFRDVRFTEFGVSRHPELRHLDTRAERHTYVELTK